MTKRWVMSLVFAVLAVGNLVQNGASDDLLTWGESGYGNGQFSFPTGLAADSSGNLYVADTGNNRIQKFTSDGVFLKRWGAMGQFSSPRGVAVDGSGNVHVADTGNNRIQKFDSDGVFLKRWGALGQFSSPRGVAVDDSGNVYVADTGNNRIQKFNSDGVFLKKWGTEGLFNGQFRSPAGVAADSSGNIYVADTGNNRIQKFDSEGVFLKKWGIEGYGNGQFRSPAAIAIDSSGDVYVADTGNNRIQRFTSDGVFLAKRGSPGQFNSPGGVAVYGSGSVYIADTGNDRIWKLTSDATDVAVSVDVDNAMPDEGDMVVYTVTVTNMGPNQATGVEVTDQLPPGVGYLSSDCNQGIYDQNAWYAGDLARHTSAWLTITAAVDPGTTGSIITNTATVTAAQADPMNDNNSNDAVIGVGGTDLTVSVEVDNAMPGEGDTIKYTLTVTNDGPNAATGLEVNCQLPPGITYVSSDASQGSYSDATGVWNVGILESSTSASLIIMATVKSGTAGNIINNTARVTADQVDPMRSNNYDSAVIYVAVADVAVSVDVDNTMPGEGYTVTYTITATNNGPNTATGVRIDDHLPTGVSYVSSAPGQGNYSADTGAWDVGILAKNTSASLTIAAKTDPGTANTSITNTAKVISADQSDPEDGNDSDSITIDVAVADVALSKNVDNATPGEGDTITYTLTLVNNGPSTATNVEVIDQLPGGVEYVSCDPPSHGSYSIDTGVWSAGSLSSNADAWLSINAVVAIGTSGRIITNAASVTADQADPVLHNNSDIAAIGVAGTDLAVSVDVDNDMPEKGDSITYTIMASNNGPNIATGVWITDHLPPGVTYESSEATQGSYSSNTGLWDVGIFAVDASASLTITVAIDTGTTGSVIINTASVASDQADPVSGNNSNSIPITVQRVDVRVLMSVSDAKPREGDRIVYTMEVKNNGPNDAVELVITDQLPSGVTHVTSTPSQGNYDNGTGVWNVGSLANGAYAAMTIIVSADPGTAGTTIINTASVTAVRPVDRDNDNDSASSSITVSYTVTATTGPDGDMEPSGAVGVVPGASQKFTVIPAEYYRVADVKVDGASVGAVAEYTFENVMSNHTIHATFELIPLELLTVTYDILKPTLIFTFSTWVDPGLTSFDMIGMEVDDSGKWDFEMSDARGLVPRTFPMEANKVIVDIKRDYVNSMNLALALEKHKRVDILMERGAFTAMSGVKSNPVTGTDNIRVHIMADGVDFGIFGDVSGDGEVTTSDAELILQAVVNESPTVFPVYNTALAVNKALDAQGCKQDVSVSVADMDNSDDISGFDASLVLQFVAGHISNLSKAVREFPDVSGSSRIGGLRVNNSKDQKLDLIVVLGDFRKVYSIDMVIEYNTEMLAVDFIRRTLSTSDWLLEYRVVRPGKLRLSLAGPSELATDDPPLTIGFHAFSENAANHLDVTEFKVNGVMGTGIVECPGSTSNLLQNYPNPFNPATWIPYQLSEDANVTIRIYDVSGQCIRTLNLGHKPAGFYTATSKAAYWDGRNEAGEHVASGVYFYTIQAGKYTSTKKMTIAR